MLVTSTGTCTAKTCNGDNRFSAGCQPVSTIPMICFGSYPSLPTQTTDCQGSAVLNLVSKGGIEPPWVYGISRESCTQNLLNPAPRLPFRHSDIKLGPRAGFPPTDTVSRSRATLVQEAVRTSQMIVAPCTQDCSQVNDCPKFHS